MTVRVRTRTDALGTIANGVRKHNYGGATAYNSVGGGSMLCNDVIGNVDPFTERWNDNALLIRKRIVRSPGTFSTSSTTAVYTWTDWRYDGERGTLAHLPLPSPPSDTTAITDIAAATNPSRPDVSMPNFLWELKDLGPAVRDAGMEKMGKKRTRGGRQTNSSVAHNFGWDLLFRDLFTLLKFSETVEKRLREVEAIHANGGLTRNRTYWSAASRSVATNRGFQSAGISINGTVSIVTTGKRWGSVRWKPDPLPPLWVPKDVHLAVRAAVHGWSFSPATVWEAMPWSWFIDYFANLGAFFNATRNSLGISCTSGCIMSHVRTERNHFANSNSSVSIRPLYDIFDEKTRTVVPIGFSARQPLIGAKQLVTLSSIAFNHGLASNH